MIMEDLQLTLIEMRRNAENLPDGVRGSVIASLDLDSPRAVFTALNRLQSDNKLPDLWDKILDDFYWSFCY